MKYYEQDVCCDPQAMKYSLCLMLEALGDESHDRMFYQHMMQLAPDSAQQEIIRSIRDDEIKHAKMFRMIYQEITGEQPQAQQKEFVPPGNFCTGIQQAIFGELDAVEMYRKIMYGLCTQRHRDMLFEIITDEMKHAVKWNFLYTENRCPCKSE